MRDIITLGVRRLPAAELHARRRIKRTHPDRMELKKYCQWCRKHTAHKETK